MQAARAKRFAFPVEPLRLLPLVLASLFVVMAAVDAMIAFQPTLLVPLRESWQRWVGSGWVPPSFASLFATGVAVAGIAIAATVLSTFVRGVQSAPFVWLAPVVVGSGAAIIAGLHVTMPLPLTPPLFAGLCTLFMLGGGALLQPNSLLVRCAGGFVLLSPLGFLLIGYAQTPAAISAQGAPQLLGVLLATSVAAGALALLTGRALLDQGLDTDATGEQLFELLERAKASETRAAQAEQQLAEFAAAGYQQGAMSYASDADEAALLRPRELGAWLLWATVLFLVSGLLTGYFVGYAPLQQRVTTQRKQLERQDQLHSKSMSALQSQFDAERRGLEAQLQAAKAHEEPAQRVVAASPAVVAATHESPSVANPNAAPAPAPVLRAPVEKLAPAIAPVPAAKSDLQDRPDHVTAKAPAPPRKKLHAAPARAAKAPAAKPAAPAGARPARDEEEPINDDPIGGL